MTHYSSSTQKCCYKLCNNSYKSIRGLRMYRFSKTLSKEWIRNCGNPELAEISPAILYQNKRICEVHFNKEHILPSGRLQCGAIPNPCVAEEIEEEDLVVNKPVGVPAKKYLKKGATSGESAATTSTDFTPHQVVIDENNEAEASTSRLPFTDKSDVSRGPTTVANPLFPDASDKLAASASHLLVKEENDADLQNNSWSQSSLRDTRITDLPPPTDSCLDSLRRTDQDREVEYSSEQPTDPVLYSTMFPERPGGVMTDTLDMFSSYMSSILRQLPVSKSYSLQQRFINEAINAKLDFEKEHPSKSLQQPRSFSPLPPPPVFPSLVTSTVTTTKPTARKAKKRKATDDSTTTEIHPLSPSNIKQEPTYDMESSSAITEDSEPLTDMNPESHSEIDIEECSEFKPDINSRFEMVLCDPDLGLQVVKSSLAYQTRPDDQFECRKSSGEQTFDTFTKRLDLPSSNDTQHHLEESHPDVNISTTNVASDLINTSSNLDKSLGNFLTISTAPAPHLERPSLIMNLPPSQNPSAPVASSTPSSSASSLPVTNAVLQHSPSAPQQASSSNSKRS